MKLNLYQKTAITTVIATIVLIFVGGLVRAAGAGLGCPDWPQCFGMWIPPTSAEGLPAQYDASLFNPFHTWLEYVNRLVGVLIGFLITLTFIISFKYRKSDPVITVTSGVAFVLVLFQGWLGGQVVQSGLSAGIITLHMIMAMIILATLLYASFRAMSGRLSISISEKAQRTFLWVSGIVLFLTLVQMVLGTQVREQVDVAKNVMEMPRESWIDSLGILYEVHRSFSWLLVISVGAMVYFNKKLEAPIRLTRLGWATALLVTIQFLSGVGMERFDMPGVFQVVHLVGLAVLICTILLYMLIAGFSWSEKGKILNRETEKQIN
jgi:heme a synthase